ncbi:hypothetical protein MACJ_000968 [Theileria orientalis]|uniref:Uncharacterized protein n=1 Tax=Theileria orientalis TaxID=68886 RepID=A0A976M4Z7_THEOR|nr:hypothetical protein MACJ_000968 [Theileria orientalis]
MFGRGSYVRTSVRFINIFHTFTRPKDKLQNIGPQKQLYPGSSSTQSNVTKIWDGIKEKLFKDEEDPDKQTEKFFQYSVEKLMESPGKFTFQSFQKYLEHLCTKLKIIGKKPLPEDKVTGILLQLRNHYRIMSMLTKHELESDSYTVFTHETKVLISEALGLKLKDVDEMLLYHDTCKTDRTWYFRRLVLGRSLPTSYKEREYLSYQRPAMRLSQQIYPKVESLESIQIKKTYDEMHYKKIRHKTWPWYRHRTSGHDYWRTRPYTKWRK